MYVYYLSSGFITSIRAFNLPTRAFSLPTCAFNLTTHAFSVLTRGFELVTRGFELVTRRFELVTRNSKLVFYFYTVVSISQLLGKKIITYVINYQLSQHVDSFCLSITETTFAGGRNCIRRYLAMPTKHSLHKNFFRWHHKQCPRQIRQIFRCD